MNTNFPPITHQNFYGGISTDEKLGIEHSHAYSRGLDFRKKPGQLTPLPVMRQIGQSIVVDLIQQIIQVDDGTRYGLGDQGYFYAINTDNSLVVKGKLDNGAAGMLYRRDVDEMYMSSLRTVSRFGKFASGPRISVNKYAQSASVDPNAFRTGGAKAINLASTISENDKIVFTPDIEPLYSVKLKVGSVGTGNWTVTIHDDTDNVLGTATVNNGSLVADEQIEFVISTPVRMLVKPNARTYHAHVTSSNATGSIIGASTELSTADFEIWADRLVSSNNGLHPIEQFTHLTCIGNERYLSVWEPLSNDPSNLEWQRHRLTFPPGNEVCGLTSTDEYLVIACEKRSTSASRNFQEGKLFFWNGSATSYDFFIDIPEGSPESIYTYHNIVYMVINGALYVWPGGKSLVKVRTLLNTDTEFTGISDTTRVYPNMMGVRRNILVFGYPSLTNSQTMEHGVFSWGAIDKNYPSSFGYNYTISTGTRTYDGVNALRIGCVRSFGDELYVSWRDDTQATGFKYGLDIVDNTSTPAASGSWESRIFDGKAVFKNKSATKMKITTAALPTGVTISPKYKIDRGSWTYPTDGVITDGGLYGISQIELRNHEVQYGFDFTSTASTPFIVTSVSLDVDPLPSEEPFNELGA